jgi:hypothetical protein
MLGGPGQGEDYGVQLAVGQCPRNCIYWVTPMQREVLENLMERYVDKSKIFPSFSTARIYVGL